jgi:hypothetical protein
MPQWSKKDGAPSLYGWINVADLRAALPTILTKLQTGGVAPLVDGGDPEAFAHPNLTQSKLKRFFKRQVTATLDGYALMELEYREWARMPVALRNMFGTAAELTHPTVTDQAVLETADETTPDLDFGEPLGPSVDM